MTALLFAAWFACQGADIATTYHALHQPGFTEGNAALRGPHLYALKVSVNVGLFALHTHVKAQHRFVIPVTMAAAGCGAAALNLRTLARHADAR
jgi:hypothetical protein